MGIVTSLTELLSIFFIHSFKFVILVGVSVVVHTPHNYIFHLLFFSSYLLFNFYKYYHWFKIYLLVVMI